MKTFSKFLWIAFLLLAVSCAERQGKSPDQIVQVDFEPTVKDIKINFGEVAGPVKPNPARNSNGEIQADSAKYLETSSLMLQSSDLELRKTGKSIADSFYSFKDSHTVMSPLADPPKNPLAFLGYEPAVKELSKKYNEALIAAEDIVTEAANNAKVPSIYTSDNMLKIVSDSLTKFASDLKNSKNKKMREVTGASDVIDEIVDGEKGLNKTFIPVIKKVSGLYNPAEKNTVVFLENVYKGLEELEKANIVDPKDLALGRKNLNRGIKIAKEVENVNDADGALGILVRLWLNWDGRIEFPPKLRKGFQSFLETELFLFAYQNKEDSFLSDEDYKFLLSRYKNGETKNFTAKELVALYTYNRRMYTDSAERYSELVEYRDKLMAGEMYTPEFQAWYEGLTHVPVIPAKDWDLMRAEIKRNSYGKTFNGLRGIHEFLMKFDKISPALGPDALFLEMSNQWMGLEQRMGFPDELNTLFRKLSESDLKSLSDDDILTQLFWNWNPKLFVLKIGISRALKNFTPTDGTADQGGGIENFKYSLTSTIRKTVQDALVDAVSPLLDDFSKLLKDAILPELEKEKKAGYQYASTLYKKLAGFYAARWFFGVTDIDKKADKDVINGRLKTLEMPWLEKAGFNVLKNSNGFESTPNSASEKSSAIALARGLENAYHQLSFVQKDLGESPTSVSSMKVNFQVFAKLGSLLGYQDYEGKKIRSLAVPTIKGHAGRMMDLKTYDPLVLPFASPDDIFIKADSTMTDKVDVAPSFSLMGQMSLLKSYALMIEGLKNWKPTVFDGINGLMIDEMPGEAIITKETLYVLAVGLSSVILRNLETQSAVTVFSDGSVVPATERQAFKESKKAQGIDVSESGALLLDYDFLGRSLNVKTASVATSIDSILALIDALEECEKSTDVDIIKNVAALKDAQKSLRELLSGIILFVTGKLTHESGGFYPGYDLKAMKPLDGPLQLDDQLRLQSALFKAAEFLDTEVLRVRGVENYFYLNSHLWNSKLGFYSLNSNGEAKVQLRHVLMSLENLEHVDSYLNRIIGKGSLAISDWKKSQEQIRALKTLWKSRFLGTSVRNLNPVFQAGDFSL